MSYRRAKPSAVLAERNCGCEGQPDRSVRTYVSPICLYNQGLGLLRDGGDRDTVPGRVKVHTAKVPAADPTARVDPDSH